ncbi:hypothetical protein [Microcoleus sp. N9_A1]|uniref:hypothetical protein n=1 Tax=Microcoleus sp. N9_A1 TaxID=3055380 RepID=UPI002FD4B27F
MAIGDVQEPTASGLAVLHPVLHPDKCTRYQPVIFLPAAGDRPFLQYLWNFDLIGSEPLWC